MFLFMCFEGQSKAGNGSWGQFQKPQSKCYFQLYNAGMKVILSKLLDSQQKERIGCCHLVSTNNNNK